MVHDSFLHIVMLLVILTTDLRAMQTNDDTTPMGIAVVEADIGIYVGAAYEMTLEADTVLSIAVRSQSNSLNPVIVLEGPEGEILAKNDDHETNYAGLDIYDALLERVSITEDGVYIIRVANRFWSIGMVDLIVVQDEVVPIADVLEAIRVGAAIPDPLPLNVPRRTTGSCSVRGGVIPANLRTDPTLSADAERLLETNQTLDVAAYYDRGEDGFIWYLVGEFLWVREDAIILEGDCSELEAR